MSCSQANICCRPSLVNHQKVSEASSSSNAVINRIYNSSLPFAPSLKYQRKQQQSRCPVCLLGGKDKFSKDDGLDSVVKAMENSKGKSIVEVLNEQIKRKEFYGSGNKPPHGGGGRGSGGGRGGGGSGNENSKGPKDGTLNEVLRVFFATLGFLFLYAYITTGPELNKLARDYARYLVKGKKSPRLKRLMYKWKRFTTDATEEAKEDKNLADEGTYQGSHMM